MVVMAEMHQEVRMILCRSTFHSFTVGKFNSIVFRAKPRDSHTSIVYVVVNEFVTHAIKIS